jgi:Holliday junction resolvasome RuvABC endonuclease subunit
MNILSLDLSLSDTGFCLREKDKNTYTFGSIKTDPKDSMHLRIFKALEAIQRTIRGVLIDKVAIEDYGYGAKGNSITKLAELGGVVKQYMFKQCIPVQTVPIKAWKKSVLGKGTLKKEDIKALVLKKFGCYFENQNICDAFCIMRHAELDNGLKLLELPEEL